MTDRLPIIRVSILLSSIAIVMGGGANRSVGAASPQAGRPASVEAWQRSWEPYVDAYNECVKDKVCKAATRFGKKRVQWEATLVELDLKRDPPSAKLTTGSPKGFDVSTPPTVFEVISPEMRGSAIEAWKAVQPGSKVRFEATIEEGGGIFARFGMVGSRFQDAIPLPRPR